MELHTVLTSGVLERIGEANSKLKHNWLTEDGDKEKTYELKIKDHAHAFNLIRQAMRESKVREDVNELAAVGHRVVHGGEAFKQPVLINDSVLEGIRKVTPLAPLHNPANLTGIEIAMSILPDIPHVAVFDTAFHQTIPDYAFRYALPENLYQTHGVRRYGFHGTSHAHVAELAAAYLQRPLEALNLITLHLGNGASVAAIQGGCCIDTSMGLTPLEGLMMGTRCGDIDPAIAFYLERVTGQDSEAIESLYNKDSGLKGVCGENDMREVLRLADAGEQHAQLAVAMYCYRIKKYIGAYYAALGRVDAIVFTAGIGENAARIRQLACAGLEPLGIMIDENKNAQSTTDVCAIHTEGALTQVLVIRTNEELEIARQTADCLQTS